MGIDAEWVMLKERGGGMNVELIDRFYAMLGKVK